MSDTKILGLREQKKQETRQEISDRATRLFIEQGFEETTIAEIAEAARVAKKTVTNYFPRKEDLAFDHHEQFVATLAGIVAGRRPGESALAALRKAFMEAAERQDPMLGFTRDGFGQMIARSPTLVARLRELQEQREEALARELAAETGDPGAVARVVAAQFAAPYRVFLGQIMELTLEGLDNPRIAGIVAEAAREVFELMEPSFGAYAVR
ncbi:TetR/AcrR family transcriptional regulator [Nonomuraea gerenzanensis]|uniref:TetR-family transcriptional regulator n=1 Tax=Nonomuraea gerenzanensis TaxID=93944 RepID=A0A1M4DXW8_9ACTN|nr:TetR/AcrR family transcriptional regulator [Nonomuraea gerenzanensis]UBU13723.1 TetR/AcrR family transcriptional regulator [Nonomuraea gerenzanensis]SBO91392.1 TetR-family transcriptional regulator [Nonomuraea gerenzanensis]